MSYKIVKVTNFYPEYLRNYYQRFPGEARKSYDEQFAHLMDDGYSWADFYARHLRSLGVDASEIVYNAAPLQNAWLEEFGGRAGDQDVLLRQLKHLKPDVLFLQDMHLAINNQIADIKSLVPSIKLILVYAGVHVSEVLCRQLSHVDVVLTCNPGFIDFYNSRGMTSYVLNHAFEPELLSRLDSCNEYMDTDVVFTGSLILGSGFHEKRIFFLEKLIEHNIDVKIYGHISTSNMLKLRAKQVAYLLAKSMRSCGLGGVASYTPVIRKAAAWTAYPKSNGYSQNLVKSVSPPVYGIEMFKVLRKSKIVLNSHIDVAGQYAGNSRLYEATGVGSCLLTDWKKNLQELFTPDTETMTYKNIDQCLEVLHMLLSDSEKRKRISVQGQKKTLSSHTFFHRAQQLDEIVRSHLAHN